MRYAVIAATIAIVQVASSVASAAVEDDLRDGDKYFEEADWSKAAAAFDRAIAKAPGQVPAEAYGKRAAIFIILKNYKGGLEFVAKAKTHYPNAPEVLEQEALILWETEHKDEAIKVAERAVALKPGTFTNQKIIGEYYSQRDAPKTVTAFELYLANRPAELEGGDVLPRIRLGFAYLGSARTAIAESDDARAQVLFGKAVDQFDLVGRKFAKKPNATVNSENGLCAGYTGLGRFDQAVTMCERVVNAPQGKKAIDPSVWFNLGTAYLARKQTQKARTAATEFTRVRKAEARGYILLGDTYFEDRDWPAALEQYQRGEKQLRPNQPHEQVQLSIRLGKTYRRLPAPASGKNPNLELAIDKLSTAFSAYPTNFELAIELGDAYLAARQDAKATALTDKLLVAPELAKASAESRAGVTEIAAKALFNQHKLKEARQRFEAAQQLRPADITIQRDLVLVINAQAFESLDKTTDKALGARSAQTLLEQALPIDPASPVTIANLAVLAIARNDCEGAQKQLVKLETLRGHDVVLSSRLLARSYLCLAHPDPKKAAETFAIAEKAAKQANAALALAEIYTEWAPLIWDTALDDAIDKLETAVNTAAQDADVSAPAKRNLALALYRRGWRAMREGKSDAAAGDFERATHDPSVLKGTEPLAFDFSFALAQLDAGRTAEAAKLFKALATKGNQAAYLKPPYAKVGSQFFAAYASYRNGTLQTRQQAIGEFTKLETDMPGDKLKELLAASWESIAVDQWKAGQTAAALKSLQQAEKLATGDAKRRIGMDRAALSLTKNDLGALEALNGTPPESLVNLGILYDQLGRPKDAYDAWVRAKARGVQSRNLQKWIDSKKRIYGF